MSSPLESRGEVTRLLAEVQGGKRGAGEALLGLVYEELRRLARKHMQGERAGHTLQATALVHEAYLRLLAESRPTWEGKSHFMAVAARAMRQILIEHARRKGAEKRGGGRCRTPLDEAVLRWEESAPDLLALDAALDRLSTVSERTARVVELRFFCGLSVEEVAALLGCSPMTVKREWRAAKAWLLTELEG